MIAFPAKEYSEAVRRESFIRDASFQPVTQDICGFEVRALTLQDFMTLRLLRSPFVVGGEPTPADLRAVLWLLSPDYTLRNGLRRLRFMLRCRVFLPPMEPRIKTKRTVKRWAERTVAALERFGCTLIALRTYLDESLQDWTSGKVDNKSISYYSDGIGIAGMIARDYGWSEKEILSLPMTRALQYVKEIKAAHGEKAMFNPSDRISFEWMRARNSN